MGTPYVLYHGHPWLAQERRTRMTGRDGQTGQLSQETSVDGRAALRAIFFHDEDLLLRIKAARVAPLFT